MYRYYNLLVTMCMRASFMHRIHVQLKRDFARPSPPEEFAWHPEPAHHPKELSMLTNKVTWFWASKHFVMTSLMETFKRLCCETVAWAATSSF